MLDYYIRARTYDPVIAMWLSQDPLGTQMPYTYVENNPILGLDPTGLKATHTWKNSYSRGNDDPFEDIFETAKIEASIEIASNCVYTYNSGELASSAIGWYRIPSQCKGTVKIYVNYKATNSTNNLEGNTGKTQMELFAPDYHLTDEATWRRRIMKNEVNPKTGKHGIGEFSHFRVLMKKTNCLDGTYSSSFYLSYIHPDIQGRMKVFEDAGANVPYQSFRYARQQTIFWRAVIKCCGWPLKDGIKQSFIKVTQHNPFATSGRIGAPLRQGENDFEIPVWKPYPAHPGNERRGRTNTDTAGKDWEKK